MPVHGGGANVELALSNQQLSMSPIAPMTFVKEWDVQSSNCVATSRQKEIRTARSELEAASDIAQQEGPPFNGIGGSNSVLPSSFFR
jgi:hypothetical protein